MENFTAGITSYPTIVYSILLIFVIIYWVFVLIGALGLDVLDFDADVVDGAAEGAAEGIAEGVAEGAAEGAAEAVEGAAEGAMEGGFSLLNFLGIGRVPATVVLSLLVGFAWVICYYAMVLARTLGVSGFLVGTAALAGAFVLGSLITSAAVRPLFPVFRVHQATSNRDLVGKVCTVSTGRVDARFGQATLLDETGGEHLIQVRSDDANQIQRGTQAVIVAYDREREAFIIEGMDNLLPPRSNTRDA
ncbi:MAG: DUF1449 family protein [Myxococcales bacterium]|nr:DUF1449 family protein [Myxococcales bacterium]